MNKKSPFYYKIKYKPYDQFIGVIEDRFKQCTDKEHKHIELDYEPTKDNLRYIVAGMIDRSRDIIFDFPHRIKDKDLEDIEVVKFER